MGAAPPPRRRKKKAAMAQEWEASQNKAALGGGKPKPQRKTKAQGQYESMAAKLKAAKDKYESPRG
jgi:hypothetical protein